MASRETDAHLHNAGVEGVLDAGRQRSGDWAVGRAGADTCWRCQVHAGNEPLGICDTCAGELADEETTAPEPVDLPDVVTMCDVFVPGVLRGQVE